MNMRKRAVVVIGLVIAMTAGLISSVSGQDVFDLSDAWMDENDPRHYKNVIDRNWQLIQQEEWAEIFSKLSEEAASTDVDWSGAEELNERFLDAMDAAIDELKEIDALYNGVYLKHLDQLHTGRFAEGTAGEGFVGFLGMNPAIVLCMEGVEQANPCNRPEHPILSHAQAEDIRYRASAANELLLILRAEADEVILEAIDTSYKRWNNFLDNRFVMYPWEIGLNSALLDWDIRTPPAKQFIFLHPSLGIQVPLDGFSDPVKFRAKESLVIEVFGHLWYQGEFLENYAGASATVVLRENLPPGIGFLIRPGRGLAAGLNWHLSANDQKQFIKTPFVTVSVNILNLIASNRGRFDF